MKKSLLLFAMFWVLSVVAAQTQIDGSGNIAVQERKLSPFMVLENVSAANVVVVQDAEYKAIVKTYDNVIRHVFTQVDGNTLTVSMEKNISYNKTEVIVEIHAPHLVEIVNSGPGEVNINSLKADEFTLINKGPGDVRSSCLLVSKTLVMTNAGPGDMIVGFMTQEDVTIANSGPGDMVLSVMRDVTSSMKVQNAGPGDVILKKLSVDDLQATNKGPGDLVLSGKADKMTVVNSGAGDVKAKGLIVKTAYITQGGVGDVNAHVTGTAYLTQNSTVGNVKISGGGTVVGFSPHGKNHARW